MNLWVSFTLRCTQSGRQGWLQPGENSPNICLETRELSFSGVLMQSMATLMINCQLRVRERDCLSSQVREGPSHSVLSFENVYQGERDALASVTAALHTKVREGEALRADNRILSTRNSDLELFVAGATKSIFLMEERLSARDLEQRKLEVQLKSLRAEHGSEVDRGRELEEERLKNMQAELQQQLRDAQVDLEDTRRQGDALCEENRILSIHNADVERQIEDERSAKYKAGERHIGMCKQVVQRTLRNQLLMAWNMFVDTVRVAQRNRKTVSKVLSRLRHRQLVQAFDGYAAAVDTLVVQRQLKNAREELEQRLHDTKAELEDISRHGEALRADNQLLNQHNLSLSTQNTELERNLSTHYADLKQQVEDERSAKMKAV